MKNFRPAPVTVRHVKRASQPQTTIHAVTSAPCPHRGPRVGWVECACQGKPAVHECRCEAVEAPYCLPHAPGKSVRIIHLDSGGEILLDGELYRAAPRKMLPVCALCEHRPPQPAERIDILHVTHRRRWQDQIRRSECAMRAHGLGYTGGEITKPDAALLRRKIEATQPRLIVVHGFSAPMAAVIGLAESMPDRRFVCVDHSSLNHTFTWPQYFAEYRDVLAASRRLRNLTVAAVDRHASWRDLGYPEFRDWPNPIYLPESVPEPTAIDPASVLIVGRADWMKAIPAQITAAALLQRQLGVRVLISLSGDQRRLAGLQAHAAACGLDASWLPYVDYDSWYARLSREVSVVLQPSMSDSCNIISIEAAIHGRPFVGSATIPHCPPSWRVTDPNDPWEIASVAAEILGSYQAASVAATALGRDLATRQNERYAAMIRGWLV